jgi:hypothetical protein
MILIGNTHSFAFEVKIEGEGKIKLLDEKEFIEKKSGDTFKIPNGSTAIYVPKYGIPMLINSPEEKRSELVLKQEDENDILQAKIQPYVEQFVTEITSEIKKVEIAIQRKEYNEASRIVGSLKEKYKNISAILFLSGSLNYLMNNKAAAKSDLEKGLALEPNNTPAKKLLLQLGGV